MILFLILTALSIVTFAILFERLWGEVAVIILIAVNAWLTSASAWFFCEDTKMFFDEKTLYITMLISFGFWWGLYRVNCKDTSEIEKASANLGALSPFEKPTNGKFVTATQMKKWVPVDK